MKKTTYEKALALRKKNLSYTQIGNLLGVSRQRAHQLLDKNYSLKRKKLYTERKKRLDNKS